MEGKVGRGEEERGRSTEGGAMIPTIPIIGNSKPLHVHMNLHLQRAGH